MSVIDILHIKLSQHLDTFQLNLGHHNNVLEEEVQNNAVQTENPPYNRLRVSFELLEFLTVPNVAIYNIFIQTHTCGCVRIFRDNVLICKIRSCTQQITLERLINRIYSYILNLFKFCYIYNELQNYFKGFYTVLFNYEIIHAEQNGIPGTIPTLCITFKRVNDSINNWLFRYSFLVNGIVVLNYNNQEYYEFSKIYMFLNELKYFYIVDLNLIMLDCKNKIFNSVFKIDYNVRNGTTNHSSRVRSVSPI